MTAVFIRALSEVDKEAAVLNAVKSGREECFEVLPSEFAKIHGSPFIYWISKTIAAVLMESPSFENRDRVTKCGLGTLDDFRFLRVRWEIDEAEGEGWADFVKGGSRSPWVSEIYMKLNWKNAGHELKRFVEGKVGSASRKIQAQDYYFRHGLTFPRRPLGMGWFSIVPHGVIFADNGPMAFVPPSESLDWLAFLNAIAPHFFMQLMMARGQDGSGQTLTYEVGIVARCPVPKAPLPARLGELAKRACQLSFERLMASEWSAHFVLPRKLLWKIGEKKFVDVKGELTKLSEEINEIVLDLFQLSDDDRQYIKAWGLKNSKTRAEQESGKEDEATQPDDVDDELLSWAVGVAFGRFDVRYATGERALPEDVDPFDPLPRRSPAMLPATTPLRKVSEILVDDPGHTENITACVEAVYQKVREKPPESLRTDIAVGFFQSHIKMYSKGRRKAPIYWQFATASGGYSVWLCVSRCDRDSMLRVLNDYVSPKVAREQRQLEALRAEVGREPSRAQARQLEDQENFVRDLSAMADEVARVAPLWHPKIQDGIVIVAAPLWRLFSHNRSWQTEVKSTWEALCDGNYDWSQLAMHFWPERVVLKCASDRSLAIAHGLEDNFWFEENGEWRARENPKVPISELVKGRTSASVKAALKSLLEAPDVSVGSKRTRKSKVA